MAQHSGDLIHKLFETRKMNVITFRAEILCPPLHSAPRFRVERGDPIPIVSLRAWRGGVAGVACQVKGYVSR